MKPLEIVASAEQVVETVRDYARSQKKFWQKIPLLALEADGRKGFSDNYSRAYKSGFWALNGSINGGHYSVYVDLATGELVDSYFASNSFSVCDSDVPKDSTITLARNEDILKLVFNLEELDAKKIVSSLKKGAKEKYSSYYNSKEKEAWRNKTRVELNLLEFYVR